MRRLRIALLLVGLHAAGCETPPVDPGQARAQMQELCTRVAARCQTCGKPAGAARTPATSAQSPLPAKLLDPWARPLRIAVAGDALTLQSAGQDGELDTADDLIERCPQP